MPAVGEPGPKDDDASQQEEHNGFVRRHISDHSEGDEDAEDENADAECSADYVYNSIDIHFVETFPEVFSLQVYHMSGKI